MARPKAHSSRSSDLRQRLLAFGGLAVIVGVVIGVLLAAGLLGGQGGGTTQTGDPIRAVAVLEPPRATGQEVLDVGPQVGKLAPDFDLSDFQGARRKLSDSRGKPVYVNFWATWCTPCLKELPDILTLLNRHAGELAVIVVNRGEPLERAQNYFRNLPRLDSGTGVSFTVNGMDPDDTLYREYQGLGMPVSFFINANGVVTALYNGIISLDVMEREVARALASAQPGG